jgi:hypothetical protein
MNEMCSRGLVVRGFALVASIAALVALAPATIVSAASTQAPVHSGPHQRIAHVLPRPAYPLRVSLDRRYLVDQENVPFLLMGDSPQALMVNISEAEADMFFADREAHGFNGAWVNLL